MTGSEARSLIEAALADLEVIPCPMCHGEQYVGTDGMRVRCPRCRGFGVVEADDDE